MTLHVRAISEEEREMLGRMARSGSVREVLQIGLRQAGHGRLAVCDAAIPDQEPCHDQDRE